MEFEIREFEYLPSTNDYLKVEAKKGNIKEGLVAVAKAQSSGRGRLGRSFSSPPGGLYISLMLQPKLPSSEAPFLTVLTGVAVRNAISRLGIKDAKIKWPNDVYIKGKKVCGILCEMVNKDDKYAVILGVGININTKKELLPPTAISLCECFGRNIDIDSFRGIMLDELSGLYTEMDKKYIVNELRKNLLLPSDEMEACFERMGICY